MRAGRMRYGMMRADRMRYVCSRAAATGSLDRSCCSS
jgi:hypothetical protein